MNLRLVLVALVAAAATLVSGPVSAAPVTGSSATTSHVALAALKTCTHTSSGTCIRGGQFCPQASYGRAGYDAVGRRYVCKGDRVHPHWMR